MESYFLIAVIWVVCGYFAFGLAYGQFQGLCPPVSKFHRRHDIIVGSIMAALGPIGVVIPIACGALKYGRLYPWEQKS